MNYFIVLEKGIAATLGEGPYSLGLISLVSGIGAIPLTALVARQFASEETALLSALFVALRKLSSRMRQSILEICEQPSCAAPL